MKNKQLKEIQSYIIKIAEGNFNSQLKWQYTSDPDLSAIQVGISMLAEELRSSTISRSYLDSIYNGLGDMLIVLNKKGEILTINNVVKKLLGHKEHEVLYKKVDYLIHIEYQDTLKKCLANVKKYKRSDGIGLKLIAKDKSFIPVSCSFSLLHNKHDQSQSILLVARDISALLNAKEQLQSKNDELNLFVYKASHDLKSPVSSMMGLISLLKNTKDKKDTATYLKMLEASIKKSDELTNDLMILGRITYAALKYEKVDVKKLINSILKSIGLIGSSETIQINVDVNCSKPFFTEKGLFHTILLNLIENAIKYRRVSHDSSYVKIAASDTKLGLVINIEDNGIGIEKSLQSHIFKMFYRATENSTGTGLGLYIVKTSIAKLGGTIAFKSELNQGTFFTLFFPHKTQSN